MNLKKNSVMFISLVLIYTISTINAADLRHVQHIPLNDISAKFTALTIDQELAKYAASMPDKKLKQFASRHRSGFQSPIPRLLNPETQDEPQQAAHSLPFKPIDQ